jgi:hypothetical protein
MPSFAAGRWTVAAAIYLRSDRPVAYLSAIGQ